MASFDILKQVQQNKLLVFAVIGYVLIQLIFFPQMYLSTDEHNYLKNSVLLSEGKISITDSAYASRASVYTNQGYVASHFIGRSIFMVPFIFFGLLGIMFSGLVIHLLNFILVILLLKKFKIPDFYSLFYLFYPAFIWSSRTLYAELLVLTGLLAGFYFFTSLKQKHWLFSGFFFSLAVLVRYDTILALFAFVLPSIFYNRKKAFSLLLGAIPIGVLIMAFNSFVYGGIASTGYGSGTGLITSLLGHLFEVDHLIYGVILLILYPLLLISPFLIKKFSYKKEFAFLIIFYFLMNARFTEFLAFDFSIESALVMRLRYLIPVIGLLIIPYSVFVDSLIPKIKFKIPKITVPILILILLVGSAVMSAKHLDLINTRSNVLETIQEVIPEGSTVIGSSDDSIYFQKNIFGDRKYYNANLGQGLAGNPENISLSQVKTNNTYIMELHYGHRVDRTSSRQELIRVERMQIIDFIEKNNSKLELIYESFEPNTLRIYKWN